MESSQNVFGIVQRNAIGVSQNPKPVGRRGKKKGKGKGIPALSSRLPRIFGRGKATILETLRARRDQFIFTVVLTSHHPCAGDKRNLLWIDSKFLSVYTEFLSVYTELQESAELFTVLWDKNNQLISP